MNTIACQINKHHNSFHDLELVEREELRAFLAEYPKGWERADEDEVAEIEALLAEALCK